MRGERKHRNTPDSGRQNAHTQKKTKYQDFDCSESRQIFNMDATMRTFSFF